MPVNHRRTVGEAAKARVAAISSKGCLNERAWRQEQQSSLPLPEQIRGEEGGETADDCNACVIRRSYRRSMHAAGPAGQFLVSGGWKDLQLGSKRWMRMAGKIS